MKNPALFSDAHRENSSGSLSFNSQCDLLDKLDKHEDYQRYMVAVKNGTKQSYAVRPYEYGEFPTPFATDSFGGGTFDPASNTLYLTVQKADRAQGPYSNPPVVVTFGFDTNTPATR